MSARGAVLGVVGAVGGFFVGGPYGAVALGSAGYQAGANMDAADKQVAAAKESQAIQAQQANDVMQRASENTKVIMNQAQTFKGEQVNAMVSGNVDVSSQSSLLALENANAEFKRRAYMGERDAAAEARRIRAQAQIETDSAKSYREATQIGAVTSILGTAASVYGNRIGKGSTADAGNGTETRSIGGGRYMTNK